MKILFDTSVVVAALVKAHAFHERAFPWLKRARIGELDMLVACHTLAELYCTLTRLPLRPRISPATARRFVHHDIETLAKIVTLSQSDYHSTIQRMADLGLTGGTIYDGLIVAAARKAGAEKLVTFNPDHFRRVWPEGEAVITMA